MIGKLISAKVLAATTFAVAAGTAATAATGSFPAPVQRALSQSLSHVGIPLPKPAAATADHGPTITSENGFGLCTAFAGKTSAAIGHSQAYQQLLAAAAAQGKSVSQFCAGVTSPSSDPTTTTTTTVPTTTPGDDQGENEGDQPGTNPGDDQGENHGGQGDQGGQNGQPGTNPGENQGGDQGGQNQGDQPGTNPGGDHSGQGGSDGGTSEGQGGQAPGSGSVGSSQGHGSGD